MATYGFKCRRCSQEFELIDVETDRRLKVQCIQCRSRDLQIVAFDDENNTIMTTIVRELRYLNERFERLIECLQGRDDDDEDGPTTLKPSH